jgi:glycine/serine hydroxymethyltransferase
MKEQDMLKVVEFIDSAILQADDETALATIGDAVKSIYERFPTLP